MTDWTANLPTIDPADLCELDLDALCQPWDGRIETDVGDGRSDVAPDTG